MAISRSLHSCLFIIHLINFLGYPRNLIQVSLLSHTLIFLELNSSALRTTPELNLSSIFLLKNLENFGDNLTLRKWQPQQMHVFSLWKLSRTPYWITVRERETT